MCGLLLVIPLSRAVTLLRKNTLNFLRTMPSKIINNIFPKTQWPPYFANENNKIRFFWIHLSLSTL